MPTGHFLDHIFVELFRGFCKLFSLLSYDITLILASGNTTTVISFLLSSTVSVTLL